MLIKFNNSFLSIRGIGHPHNPNFYCIYFSKSNPYDFGVDNNWLWFKKNKGLGNRIFMLFFVIKNKNYNDDDDNYIHSLTFTRYFTLLCDYGDYKYFELKYNHDLDNLILKIYNYLLKLVK